MIQQPVTHTDINQLFIEMFSEALTKPHYLTATFDCGTKIVLREHDLQVYDYGNGNFTRTNEIRISTIKDIEYSSGMLIFHHHLGKPTEVDIA